MNYLLRLSLSGIQIRVWLTLTQCVIRSFLDDYLADGRGCGALAWQDYSKETFSISDIVSRSCDLS